MVLDDRNIDLIGESIDVALRMGVLADSSLTARRIAQCARRVVGTPDYFAKHGTPQSPTDLARHRAVIYEQRGGGGEWSFRKGTTETHVTLQGRMRVNAAEGVREAVLSGLGLAVASEWMFMPEISSSAVITVLDDWSLPPIDLSAVYPAGRMASAKARAFIRFVEEQLGAVATA